MHSAQCSVLSAARAVPWIATSHQYHSMNLLILLTDRGWQATKSRLQLPLGTDCIHCALSPQWRGYPQLERNIPISVYRSDPLLVTKWEMMAHFNTKISHW